MTERMTHEEYVAMQRRRVAALAILAVFLVVISLLTRPARVRANAAEKKPASQSGDRLRDPQGELKSVHIEHELLLIDMRPLAQGRPVVIEANYQVRNEGAGRAVELVFVAPALTPGLNGGGWVWREAQWVNDETLSPVTEGGVWLDGQAVTGVRPETGGDTLPKDWQPPKATPALEGSGKALPYQATSSSTIRSSLAISANGNNEEIVARLVGIDYSDRTFRKIKGLEYKKPNQIWDKRINKPFLRYVILKVGD